MAVGLTHTNVRLHLIMLSGTCNLKFTGNDKIMTGSMCVYQCGTCKENYMMQASYFIIFHMYMELFNLCSGGKCADLLWGDKGSHSNRHTPRLHSLGR